MSAWWRNPIVRRLRVCVIAAAILAVITGPPGSNEAPLAGFSGSFAQSSPFFGLFQTQRWVVFFFLALVGFALWTAWQRWGSTVSASRLRARDRMMPVVGRYHLRGASLWAILVVALLLPHIVHDAFWQQAMTEQIGVYVLLAVGLNVVVGFAGLLDLGYVAFYAIGAYTTAWVTGSLPTPPPFHIHWSPFVAIPVAIVLAMLAGVILGAPTLRLRGDYLAIVTLGFGEIITIFANNLYGITGGSQGTNPIPHPALHVGPVHIVWNLGPIPYYYLAIIFIVIFLVAFRLLEHSRVGRAWTAIREDEVAAESVGINPLKYKVMAFAIGASTAGFAGVVTASQVNQIFPSTFTLFFSINVLVLVIFGGMGSILGTVIGAVLIQTVTSYLLHTPPSGYQPQDLYIYLGALLVVMMIFRPVGLVPSRRRRREIGLAEAGEGHMDEVLRGDQP